jgi:hypothetical protein
VFVGLWQGVATWPNQIAHPRPDVEEGMMWTPASGEAAIFTGIPAPRGHSLACVVAGDKYVALWPRRRDMAKQSRWPAIPIPRPNVADGMMWKASHG